MENPCGNKLPINEFHLNEMCNDPSILMIGQRGSGKSHLTATILKQYVNIPHKIIISPTERDCSFFSDIFPDAHIHYKYDDTIVNNLLIRQKLVLKALRENSKENNTNDNNYEYHNKENIHIQTREQTKALIVLDNCLANESKWLKSLFLLDLLFNGRHRAITCIIAMQFPLDISPELKASFDYVFLLPEDFTSNLIRIYEDYAGIFPDFNSFRQVFKQLTENYGVIAIKNRGPSTGLFDKIFSYKSKDIFNKSCSYRCNTPDPFSFSYKNTDSDSDSDSDDECISYNMVVFDHKNYNDNDTAMSDLCLYDNTTTEINHIDPNFKNKSSSNTKQTIFELLYQCQQNQNLILQIIHKLSLNKK